MCLPLWLLRWIEESNVQSGFVSLKLHLVQLLPGQECVDNIIKYYLCNTAILLNSYQIDLSVHSEHVVDVLLVELEFSHGGIDLFLVLDCWIRYNTNL